MYVKEVVKIFKDDYKLGLVDHSKNSIVPDLLFIAERNSRIWDMFEREEVSSISVDERKDCNICIHIKQK